MNKIILNNLKLVMVGAILFVGFLGFINSASAVACLDCDPTLTCSPLNQTGDIGDVFNFSANGGNGTYSWTANSGAPSSGSGQNFSTTYSAYGNKTVTVKSGNQTATCNVTVECEDDGVCTPPTGLTPRGTINSPTESVTLGWNPVPGAAYYNVRLDDGSSDRYDDPRFETCSDNLHYYCENHVTVTSIPNVPVIAGRTYRFWVDPQYSPAREYCNAITIFTIVNNPPVPTLSCNPTNQAVDIGQPAGFSASGGTGTYSWSASGGNPGSGNGTNFSTSYSTAGSKTVTVSSGSKTATCVVQVNNPPVPTLSCNPANQTVGVNATANFSATGGTGTYSWSASGGNPASGSAQNFSTSYSTTGSKTVTVTSGSQTATCNVAVNPPTELQLSCNPANQSVNTNSPANFSASGGNGTYNWSTNVGSDSGNPASGTGINFTTTYNTPGYKTVTVSSGSQTVACNVTVNEPPQNALTCNPQNQSVYINSSANFSATGGTGTYNWSTSDGSPATGTGSNFSTSYSSVGARTVTVTSGAQTATCNVVVNTQPSQTLTCNPQTQSGYVWTYLNFSATGGTGTYNWFTNDGSPSTGNGSNFSTQFFNTGLRTVIVSSGDQTATCNVTINQQQQNNLTCGPQNQSANVNDNVNFYASGGNGTYSWSAHDAQTTFGNGQNFTTRFNSVGSKNVTVTSNNQTATCYVNINAVYSNSTSFQITKNVLNKTLNQNVYVNSVEAQSGDLLEFEIRVRNTGNTSAEITLKDLLPSDLNYVSGSATSNNYYLNDSVVNYNGVSLGNFYPGEEKIIRLRATVRMNAPAVTITNQAVGIMNSNTQNAFATIQLRNRGQVLGAADVVTGPEDVMPWALGLGFATSLIIYFYFFYSRPEQRKVSFAAINLKDEAEVPTSSKDEVGIFKAVRPKKELDSLISNLKKEEIAPDV